MLPDFKKRNQFKYTITLSTLSTWDWKYECRTKLGDENMVFKESFYSNTTCFNVPSSAHSGLLHFIKKKWRKNYFLHSTSLVIYFIFLNFEATVFQSSSASSLVLENSHENSVPSRCLLYFFFSLEHVIPHSSSNSSPLLTLGLKHRAIGLSILFAGPIKADQSSSFDTMRWIFRSEICLPGYPIVQWFSFIHLLVVLLFLIHFVFHSGWRNSESSETT